MSILNVSNVSHSFGGRQILEDVSFRLLNGDHIGLVGANGEGKSTFLNIITGKLQPEDGKVEWCNRITTGYMDQHSQLSKGKSIKEVLNEAFQYLFDLENELLKAYDMMQDATDAKLDKLMNDVGEIQDILDHGGFYEIEQKISECAKGLGLLDIGLDKDVSELSGGQRSKVLLCKLLLQNPMILILDEPTNYLDEEHVKWLENFLCNYDNALILVSHDIPFLSSIANVIYHIENCALDRYKGSYQDFLNAYEVKKKQQLAAYNRQVKEVKDLEDFIARNKARVATRNMANSRQKKLDKMDIIDKPKTKIKPEFKFNEARTPGRVIFKCNDLVIGYDEALTKPLNYELERNKRIAIKGVNGLGKTTLLNTLFGLINSYSGNVELDPFLEIGFFKQEEVSSNKTALQEFWDEFSSYNNGEVRAALAKCGLTTDHIESNMNVLSGGENAKVRLCKIMNSNCNVLVLDEPTNHLDIDAKEELIIALNKYKGTIILVSHENEFYEKVVDEVWNLEEYSLKII